MSPAAFHIAILRSAAMLVPQWQRPDWIAEWQSELWHVRQDPHGANVAAFCIGAFRDAFWLRRNDAQSHGVLHLDVPPTPAGIESFPDQGEAALASPVRCLSWLAALATLCAALAFLLPASRLVLLGALYPRTLVVLAASESDARDDPYNPYPSVSREQFEELKARDATRSLPSSHSTNRAGGTRPKGLWWGSCVTPPFATAGSTLSVCATGRSKCCSSRCRCTCLRVFWFHIMTSGSMRGQLQRSGIRRGLFLAAKGLLVLPIVIFGSLDVASLGRSVSPIYFDVVFFGGFFAVRWIVADQRQRCPVCLRLLAHPVRIRRVVANPS